MQVHDAFSNSFCRTVRPSTICSFPYSHSFLLFGWLLVVCAWCAAFHIIELNYSWITFNNSNDGTTFFPGLALDTSTHLDPGLCAFTIILNFTKRNLNRLTVLIKFVVWTFWLVDVCVCAINFPFIFANVASKLMSCSVYYCFFFLLFSFFILAANQVTIEYFTRNRGPYVFI